MSAARRHTLRTALLLLLGAAAAWPAVAALAAQPVVADGGRAASTSPEAAAVRAALRAGSPLRAARTAAPSVSHAALRIHDQARMAQAREALYRQRNDRALWIIGGVPTPQARALCGLLSGAADYGLQPQDYEAGALTATLDRLLAHGPRPAAATGASAGTQGLSAPPLWAAFEVELSAAVLSFVADLHSGRIDPRSAGFDLLLPNDRFDLTGFVAALAASPRPATLIARAEPAFIHYRLLKQALRHYRALEAIPALTQLPPLPHTILEPGGTYEGAAALRRLLRALGCLPADAAKPASQESTALDASLVGALRQFQWLHGLAVDGRLGPRTYAALTTPLAWRVRQIELTLERWRWLPPLTGPTIIVNIPQFRLFAFEGAQDSEIGMLRMNVIVGAEYPRRRTPVFAADMRTVIFRPYWDVPRSITANEILPRLAREPQYLDSAHLELVRGPSDASPVVPATPQNLKLLALGQLRLRQRPGADNALGLVKFLLPNAHDVYLHDTPETHLFARAQRTFSHGCIRVSDPVALAVYALRGTSGDWTASRVEAAMHSSMTQRVNLAQPIHVLIVYGTAVASEDGTVHFFDDVYGHDRKLNALLDLPAPPRQDPQTADTSGSGRL